MDNTSSKSADVPPRYPRGRMGERPEKPDPRRRAYQPPLVSRPYPPPRGRSTHSAQAADSTPSGPPPPDLVFIVGRDATVHYCNRAAALRSNGDVLGTSLLDYVLDPERATAQEVLDRVFVEGKLGGFDARGELPFTEGAWYECRVAPNERDGRVVSATVIARDVSHVRAAEHKLRAARDRLQTELEASADELRSIKAEVVERGARHLEHDRWQAILEDAGEAILVIDPASGQFIDANQTACRWLGHSRSKLLTMTSADLDLGFMLPVPDRTREHVADTRATPRPIIRTGDVVRRSDGTAFTAEVSVLRRRVTGRDYFLVVARDMDSGRAPSRKTDDGYRGLFEIAYDPMYLSGRDGSIADVNAAACRLFGYERDEFVGLPASKLYTRPGDIRAFQQVVGAHGAVEDLDVEFITKGGKIIRGQLTVKYRTTPNGTILGYQCMIRPVSQEIAVVAGAPARKRTAGATVLVVDSDPAVLAEATEVLDRAGIPSVTTETVLAAIEVLRGHAGQIGVALLGVDPAESELMAMVNRLHHADTTVPIVLMSEHLFADHEQPEAMSGIIGVVRKPLYPLALVEQVRQALV